MRAHWRKAQPTSLRSYSALCHVDMQFLPAAIGSTADSAWQAWIGFNVTHSFFLILFGAVYGYLAIRHSEFLFRSWFLLALSFALLLSCAIVARLYFFTSPFRGVVLATVLYLLGIVVNRA